MGSSPTVIWHDCFIQAIGLVPFAISHLRSVTAIKYYNCIFRFSIFLQLLQSIEYSFSCCVLVSKDANIFFWKAEVEQHMLHEVEIID